MVRLFDLADALDLFARANLYISGVGSSSLKALSRS